MKNRIEIIEADTNYAKEFYNEYQNSFKGYVALLNNEVIGIAGLGYFKDKIVLFSDMKEKARGFKKDIVKMIHKLEEKIKSVKFPIMAIASNDEMLSSKILVRMGFLSTGQSTEDGSIYWRRP